MLDLESLVNVLLTAGFPDAEVTSEQESDLTYPAIIWSASGDGQTGNGPGLWNVALDISVIGTPDVAFDLASRVYDAVHMWPGITNQFGHINAVTDESMFSRVSSVDANAKDLRQYSASFSLLCRSI